MAARCDMYDQKMKTGEVEKIEMKNPTTGRSLSFSHAFHRPAGIINKKDRRSSYRHHKKFPAVRLGS
jgi:hypothetical protein